MLFILDARDRAEATIKKADGYLNKFAGTAQRTGAAMKAAGDEIDSSLLKTASGADAVEVAAARVEGAQAKLTAATEEQAAAERNLMDLRSREEASAAELASANDKLSAADQRAATATKELKDAQKLQSDTAKAAATAAEGTAVKTDLAAASADKSKSAFGGMGKTATVAGLGVLLAGGYLTKAAADYQQSTTVLQTSGGETAAQMAGIRKGILDLSSSTGTALKPLVDGMYQIGSAGYTGGAGLRVLQAASQGAIAEGSDLGTVSNALTTILKDYGVQITDNAAGQTAANAAMNQMITIVQNGKTTTEQLAGSLSQVLPVASAVGLSFSQVGGAMATMTGQGESAQQSAQNLANLIRALSGGNQTAAKTMQSLGLNVTDVQKTLAGPGGLTGALAMVTNAIQTHLGPDGMVAVQAFQNSATAADDAHTMIAKMPKALQDVANQYLNTTISSKDFKKQLQGMDPISAHLMEQFAGTADKAHEFNDMLANGTSTQKTATAMLQQMLGGATGLNVGLMLGGKNAATFNANVQKVAAAAKGAGKDVDGWKVQQQNLNQKMAEAKRTVEAAGISIGTALLPAMTSLVQHAMRVIQPIADWIEKHQKLTVEIGGAVAGLGLLVGSIRLATKAFNAVKTVVGAVASTVRGAVTAFKAVRSAIGAVSSAVKSAGKVFDLFSGSADAAAASADGAAASADGAAASADGLAASEDGATASTEASTVAQDANSGSLIRSGLAAVGAAAKFVIMKTAQVAVTLATKAWTVAQWLFNAAMEANPIVLVITAIAALAGGVIYAYTHFQAFREIVGKVWDWLKGAVTDVIDFVKSHWELIVDIITGPIGIVATQIYDHWQTIKRYFTDAVNDIIGFLTYWFVGLPLKFAGWLASVVSTVAGKIAEFVSWWVGLPGRVASAIVGYFSGLAGDFGTWIHGVWNSIDQKGKDVLQWFKDLPGKIKTALGDLSKTLWKAGTDLIQGLIDGIGSMFGKVADKLGDLTSMIPFHKGPPVRDKSLLSGNGRMIIESLITGFDQEIPAVQAKLQGLTANIQQNVTQTPALPPFPASSPAAGRGGGTTIVQNFDFKEAKILNERDMDQLVGMIGRSMAVRVLPQGGLRVAM